MNDSMTGVLLIVVVVLGLGLIGLEVQLWQLKNAYKAFFSKHGSGGQPESLQHQLNDYAHDVADALDKLDQLATFTAQLHKKGQLAVSKIGLIRFNPFNDTGGNQSFCLALLDNHNSGLVISSIHARTGTRFYAKQIAAGKPSHPLSDEEQQAYQKAVNQA